MKTNVKRAASAARTHEGARAYTPTPTNYLRRLLATTMLFEGTYYVDGEDIAKAIQTAAARVDPKVAFQLAIEARTRHKIRHAPLWMLAGIAREETRPAGFADALAQVVERADEIPEFLRMLWDGKARPRIVPKAVQRGLAKAFNKFDAYQLAKYRGEKADVTLVDALRLVRPKPKDEKQAAAFKALREGTLRSKGTWESKVGSGQSKKSTFTELLEAGKLGDLALLKNLRLMDEEGVAPELVEDALQKARFSRVLPFRFFTAARHAPRFARALDTAMQRAMTSFGTLSGRTNVLVDVSYSMNELMTGKTEMTLMDASSVLAVMAIGMSDNARLFTFSNQIVEVPAYPSMATIEAIKRSQTHQGTRLGQATQVIQAKYPANRLIVFTDEQSHDQVPVPKGKAYMINVAPYRPEVGFQHWIRIGGFSEATLRFIHAVENID